MVRVAHSLEMINSKQTLLVDAVPRKRGPKTDVLDALLKRVDGLEKRLRHEGDQNEDNAAVVAVKEAILEVVRGSSSPEYGKPESEVTKDESATSSPPDAAPGARQMQNTQQPLSSSSSPSFPSNEYASLLLDTYFGRIHGKPYYILEASTRQLLMSNQLPQHLRFAVFAVSARLGEHINVELAHF